jgi:hypothetical protein
MAIHPASSEVVSQLAEFAISQYKPGHKFIALVPEYAQAVAKGLESVGFSPIVKTVSMLKPIAVPVKEPIAVPVGS